jgi:hypothetical protein
VFQIVVARRFVHAAVIPAERFRRSTRAICAVTFRVRETCGP